MSLQATFKQNLYRGDCYSQVLTFENGGSYHALILTSEYATPTSYKRNTRINMRIKRGEPTRGGVWPKNPRGGTWIVLSPYLFQSWRYESNYHGCLQKTFFSNFREEWAVILPCPTLDKMSHWLLPLKSIYNVLAGSQVHSSPTH